MGIEEAFDIAMEEMGVSDSDFESEIPKAQPVEEREQVGEVPSPEQLEGVDPSLAEIEPPKKARDDKGRFAKKEEPQEQEVKETQEDEGDPEAKPLKPHGSLSKEEKEVFSKLDRSMQEFVNRRASESAKAATQSQQEAAQLKRQVDSIKQAMEPYRNMLRPDMTEAELVKGALQDYAQLANPQTRLQALHRIALANQVTPQELTEYLSKQQQVDPVHLQAQQRAQALQEQNRRLQAQQSQAPSRAIEQIIESVKTETNQDGTLKRVHFDAVENDVATLMKQEVEANPAILQNPFALQRSIANAYDRVISEPDKFNSTWANPALREEILQRREKSLGLETTRSRTAKAKQAQTGINRAGTVSSTAVKPRGLDAVIDAAWAELES